MKKKRGLVIYSEALTNGIRKITLDDVTRNDNNVTLWNKDCFVTSKNYDEEHFDTLNFSEKELADFGYFILARLYSFKKCDE